MPFQLRKLQVLLAKVETTEGVDASPVGTDAIRLVEPAGFAFGAEVINERPDLHNQLLDEAAPTLPSGKWAEMTVRAEVRGRGAAYSAGVKPELDALFQAAGMSVTSSFTGGSEFYEYDTASTSLKTVTLYGYQHLDTGVAVLHKLLAGRVSALTFNLAAGKPVTAEFVVRGIYAADSDVAIVTPTYQTAVAPPLFAAAGSWSFGSYATAKVREATVGIENTLAARTSANAVDALAGYAIARRRGVFTARFEAERISDYAARSIWAAATVGILNIDIPGGTGTQYNRAKIDADKGTIREAPTYEDDNGLVLYGVSGILTPEGTNRVKVRFD